MVLRSGGIIIDNPGIREVHLWTDEATLRERFADLDELAMQCKFNDCRHGAANLGCAIQASITAGKLDSKRLDGFLKLDDEIAILQQNQKKRQLTVDRRTRRVRQSQSRKFSERYSGDPEHH